MTELLVGTRKGLFVLDGEPGGDFEITDAGESRFTETRRLPMTASIRAGR